jgi:hypothetical protein
VLVGFGDHVRAEDEALTELMEEEARGIGSVYAASKHSFGA